jgi:transposase
MSGGDMTDSQWDRIQLHLPKELTGKRAGQGKDPRLVINGILWIERTGAPWPDLPERYGPHQTCYERLVGWQPDRTWLRVLQSLQAQADQQENVEWTGCALDSTSIKAHPHAAGARHAPAQKGERKRTGRLDIGRTGVGCVPRRGGAWT